MKHSGWSRYRLPAVLLKAIRLMDHSPATRTLQSAPELTAPDGSTVRPLCRITSLGSFAHFQLEAGETSTAVSHRTVQEVWYIIDGAGCMWRQQGSVTGHAPHWRG